MECLICNEKFNGDVLNHIRLMHPLTLDQKTESELLSLKPVTQNMHNQDWVCEGCDRQFRLGMVFGERFEAMFHGLPIVSLVCAECFWSY